MFFCIYFKHSKLNMFSHIRFPNLGIQHVTKKNVANILEERYIAAEMQLSSINDGFPQEVQRNIKGAGEVRIMASLVV